MKRWILGLYWPLLALAQLVADPVRAEEPRSAQIRSYDVLVQDRPAGYYRVTYAPGSAHTTHVKVDAEVKFTAALVYSTKYTLHCHERWADGRLTAYDGEADDDGTQNRITARLDVTPRVLRVNGRRHELSESCAWTTTFSILPEQHKRGRLTVLDVDTGECPTAKVEWIESTSEKIGAEFRPCDHYRISGAVEADVWFDKDNRLVRQRFTDSGYKVEVRLKSIE